MDNISYLLALHTIDGLGPIRLKAILENFKDPKLAWEANDQKLLQIGIPKGVVELLIETRRKLIPQKYMEDIKKQGIKWVSLYDEIYPKLLKQIYDPPIILYYKGEFSLADEKAIAIVGTRKMTGYGKAVTDQFTKGLVASGLTIVSGLARGVDSQAHLVAVKMGGRTIAVLGGGLNQIYPPENKTLADQIINGFGVVLSEFSPDYASMPGNFPARNGIISGLSLGVVVIEAAEDSGSLITARLALEQGRDVFAVPGPINSDYSKGPVGLIKEGAKPVMSPEEIIDEMGFQKMPAIKIPLNNLSEGEQKVLQALENETKHIDELCRILNLSAANVSSCLLKMEILGLVRNLGGGTYCRS